MRVLVACEESQRVCAAFRELGHEAYSCDIQKPSGGHPEWHILGDALKAIQGQIFIQVPRSCIANKGTRRMSNQQIPFWNIMRYAVHSKGGAHTLNEERLRKGIEASHFFLRFLWANIDRIAVENPVPSSVYCLPEYTQTIQPYQFGHPYTKRTCLWLKGLPKLKPTNEVKPIATWCPSGSYSKKHGEQHRGMFTTDRARNRSKTFEGIAQAMAEQWGGDIRTTNTNS